MMNVAEPRLARIELHTGGAGFALLVCAFAFGIGSTFGALRGRADGWTRLATLAGGGVALVASHTDARVVFAVSGAAALVVALVSTVLLLRAGVVGGLRVRFGVSARCAWRTTGFAGAPVQLGEPGS